jgi:hypothetical protein
VSLYNYYINHQGTTAMPLKPPLQSFAMIHAKDSDMPRKLQAEAAQGFGERLATLRKIANMTQTAFRRRG